MTDVDPSHLNIVLEKLDHAGCDLSIDDNSISIKQNNSFGASDITTDVHPGFPTDLQAQWIALMSVADGTSVVTETIYLIDFHTYQNWWLGCKYHRLKTI